jgi:putative membrane protein
MVQGEATLDSADREPAVLLGATLAALAVSGIAPHDRFTWVLEVAPILIAVPVLCATYRRFRFTPLAYRLIALHAVVLMVGGHYTYANVPVGFYVQNALHLARNDYDRFGHLMQGFVPAIVSRELFLRQTPLRRGGWLFTIVVCACLAVSAAYELVEWAVAEAEGSQADAFLGTQGDPWDTQWDMFCALLGAIASLLLLSRTHDRQLASVSEREG